MSVRTWRFRIEDMLNAIAGIAEDIEGLNYEAFLHHRTIRNSVARELEIMGEAAKYIPPDIEAYYPDIPWHFIRGMRNVIAHEYFGVDWQIVWETATADLPILVPRLRQILTTTSESTDA